MAAALMGVKGAVPGVTLNKLQWLLKERIGLQWFADVVSRLHLNVFKVSPSYPPTNNPSLTHAVAIYIHALALCSFWPCLCRLILVSKTVVNCLLPNPDIV
jgi:hypothetical protein